MNEIPLTPKQAKTEFENSIPDFIINAVNSLLKEKIGNFKNVKIFQNEILQKCNADESLKQEIFKKKWLDIESLYCRYGWTVGYEKPAYNENFEPYFTFSEK